MLNSGETWSLAISVNYILYYALHCCRYGKTEHVTLPGLSAPKEIQHLTALSQKYFTIWGNILLQPVLYFMNFFPHCIGIKIYSFFLVQDTQLFSPF